MAPRQAAELAASLGLSEDLWEAKVGQGQRDEGGASPLKLMLMLPSPVLCRKTSLETGFWAFASGASGALAPSQAAGCCLNPRVADSLPANQDKGKARC